MPGHACISVSRNWWFNGGKAWRSSIETQASQAILDISQRESVILRWFAASLLCQCTIRDVHMILVPLTVHYRKLLVTSSIVAVCLPIVYRRLEENLSMNLQCAVIRLKVCQFVMIGHGIVRYLIQQYGIWSYDESVQGGVGHSSFLYCIHCKHRSGKAGEQCTSTSLGSRVLQIWWTPPSKLCPSRNRCNFCIALLCNP